MSFTEHEKIKLTIERLYMEESEYPFLIRDTGIDIESRSKQRIVKAFVQEDISTTKRFGGTVLGVTISNSILARMRSKIWLTSEVGKGSLFYFDLTLEKTPA